MRTVITTIAPAHLGNFEHDARSRVAKAEIFEGVVPGGQVVLNRRQRSVQLPGAYRAGLRYPAYSFLRSACEGRVSPGGIQRPDQSSTLWITIDGETKEVAIGAPGRHIAENALAALGRRRSSALICSKRSRTGDPAAGKGQGPAASTGNRARHLNSDRREL